MTTTTAAPAQNFKFILSHYVDGDGFGIEIDCPAAEELPQELIKALRELGWQTAEDRGLHDFPADPGRKLITLSKSGDKLFGYWSADNLSANEAELKALVERFAIEEVACESRERD